MCACMLSHCSHVRLCVTLWTAARQAALSMGFSRQGYWSALPCPPLGDLLDPGIEPVSLTSPALAGGFFNISATWECLIMHCLSNPVCQPPLPAYWPSEVPEQFGYFVWEKYEEDF